MNLKIYSELAYEKFFAPPFYLEKEGKLGSVEFIGSRFLYYAYMRMKGKKIYPFFKSLFAPFRLIFTKDPIIVPFAPYGSSIYYLTLLKLLRKKIIYHTSWPYWDGSKSVHKGGFIRKFLWRRFLRDTKVICITKEACDGVNSWGAKGINIPHPVDLEIFTKKTRDNKKVKTLFVGRLIREKGILDILKLAEDFKNVDFVFVGKGDLAEKVINCGLSNVKYRGFISDSKELARVYRETDIFISNSYATNKWEELFGISTIEAMASGLAIIATDCVGPREIIKNGENGFLIKQRDYGELRKRFNELIKNKNLRKKLGDNARKSVGKYDIKIIAEKWLDLLK